MPFIDDAAQLSAAQSGGSSLGDAEASGQLFGRMMAHSHAGIVPDQRSIRVQLSTDARQLVN
ncbi:hypothetical protein BGP79_07465 [Tersicoccus sp. Bi-70]|nr:hypothetical protein BGP79_07465 [Tersicoccus sp. Bi-70]